MLKTIIDGIPEHPVALNTWNESPPNYSSEECTSNKCTVAVKVPILDLPLDLPNASSLLSPKQYEYPNPEEEKKLFDMFMALPEISANLNFYKNSLETKFQKAKLFANTIEKCQKQIIEIKQQLDLPLSWNERNHLLPKLEEQQALYKKTLMELRDIQNETVHLQCGLKKAEVKSQHKFKIWVQEYTNSKKMYRKQYNEKMYDENIYDKVYYKVGSYLQDQVYPTSEKVNGNLTDFNSTGDNKVFQDAKYNNLYTEQKAIDNGEAFPQKYPITNVAYYFQNPYYEHNSNVDSGSSTACVGADLDKQSGSSTQYIHCCHQFNSNSTLPPPNSPEVSYPSIDDNEIGKSIESLPEDLVATKESNSVNTLENTDEMLENIVSKESNTSIITLRNDCSASNEDCLVTVSDIHHENEESQLKEEIEPAEKDELGNIEKYFLPTDTMEYKMFMKTVSLTGLLEIDEEIFNFYRSKFC